MSGRERQALLETLAASYCRVCEHQRDAIARGEWEIASALGAQLDGLVEEIASLAEHRQQQRAEAGR